MFLKLSICFVFLEDDYRYIWNVLIYSFKFGLISFYLFWNFMMKQGVALLLPCAFPEVFGCLWSEVNSNIYFFGNFSISCMLLYDVWLVGIVTSFLGTGFGTRTVLLFWFYFSIWLFFVFDLLLLKGTLPSIIFLFHYDQIYFVVLKKCINKTDS